MTGRRWYVDEVMRDGAFVHWKIASVTPWDGEGIPPLEMEQSGCTFFLWSALRQARRALKRANTREEINDDPRKGIPLKGWA